MGNKESSEDNQISRISEMKNGDESLQRTKYGIQESCGIEEKWDIVVAFDIGTSFSGYAYSDKKEIKEGSIVVNKWTGNMVKDEFAKAPTTILVSPDKQFHSFGYDAEDIFARKMTKKSGEGVWYRFRHFKMRLYYEKNFHRDMKIKDDTEKIELPALDMFSFAIRSLKQHFERAVKERQLLYDKVKVLYVITVPAIWKESAKKFMCEAAIKADIPETQLMIVLEPEAAALFCQTLPDHSLANTFKPGSKYMILDLGGGTADTVVHHVLDDGSLVEVYKASGGPWGGTAVDKEFKTYVKRLFKEDTCLEKLWDNAPRDALDLESDFENQKRQLTNQEEDDVRLKLPRRLTIYGNVESDKSLTFDHLYVENSDFKRFFEKAIENITQHIQFVLKETGNDVDQIIPVGGFSCSRYLIDKIKEHSQLQNIALCLTKDAGMAVLKGAVKFGYKPRTVVARISRYAFGFNVLKPFDEKIHPREKRVIVDGIEKCNDVFEVLVYESERIGIDECRSKNLSSSHRNVDRKHINLQLGLYMAKNIERNRLYFITDPNFEYIGKIVNHPPEGGWPDHVDFKADVYFGQACIKIKDKDITNDVLYNAEFDLPD